MNRGAVAAFAAGLAIGLGVGFYDGHFPGRYVPQNQAAVLDTWTGRLHAAGF